MKANRKGSSKVLMTRLEARPELMERVTRILDLAENRGGEVFRAAEAEERAIREIKAWG
jgi:hypothetical protein